MAQPRMDNPTRRPWFARRWPVLRGDVALMIGCAMLVAFGVMPRANDLADPPRLSFDENHFVDTARNYLSGAADRNDHPPLGKLFIAASMRVFGDKSLFWRLPSLIASLLSLAVVYRLAAKLFRDERAGWIAAALIAVDGFFIAYSRTALLDGMLAMLILSSAVFIVQAKRWWHVAIASVLIGLAAGVKFTGIVMIPALSVAIAARHRQLRWSSPLLLLIPAVYFAQYALGRWLTGQPAGVGDVVAATRKLVQHHQGLTAMAHPSTSPWYTWFLPLRPLTLRSVAVHPVSWWLVNLGLGLLLVRLPQRFVAFVSAKMGMAAPVGPGRFLGPARPWAWAALLWLLPVLPWILSRRDSRSISAEPRMGIADGGVGRVNP